MMKLPDNLSLDLFTRDIRNDLHFIEIQIDEAVNGVRSDLGTVRADIEELKTRLKDIKLNSLSRHALNHSKPIYVPTAMYQTAPIFYVPAYYFSFVTNFYSYNVRHLSNCSIISKLKKVKGQSGGDDKAAQRRFENNAKCHKYKDTKQSFKNVLKSVCNNQEGKMVSYLRNSNLIMMTTSLNTLSEECLDKSQFKFSLPNVYCNMNNAPHESKSSRCDINNVIENFCSDNNVVIDKLNKKFNLSRSLSIMSAIETFCVDNVDILNNLKTKSTNIFNDISQNEILPSVCENVEPASCTQIRGLNFSNTTRSSKHRENSNGDKMLRFPLTEVTSNKLDNNIAYRKRYKTENTFHKLLKSRIISKFLRTTIKSNSNKCNKRRTKVYKKHLLTFPESSHIPHKKDTSNCNKLSSVLNIVKNFNDIHLHLKSIITDILRDSNSRQSECARSVRECIRDNTILSLWKINMGSFNNHLCQFVSFIEDKYNHKRLLQSSKHQAAFTFHFIFNTNVPHTTGIEVTELTNDFEVIRTYFTLLDNKMKIDECKTSSILGVSKSLLLDQHFMKSYAQFMQKRMHAFIDKNLNHTVTVLDENGTSIFLFVNFNLIKIFSKGFNPFSLAIMNF